jgi:uncharacterized BrkB/YihY/UPF0761 family membrane protein
VSGRPHGIAVCGVRTAALTTISSGAVLALLLWLYYSGMIFFFGAEFAQARSQLRATSLVSGQR